ncbi:hypothetical protein Psi02_42820 [Planotetraspora silvatica]|uniref:Uncharacterized protein n=1 Tax=Planotetraspora silvatica TaxID=234614 RepID=A0A8J3UMD1_9ACTN|nr:hypothetical protein Psi02_42820 [Planotetraspora silvatica]
MAMAKTASVNMPTRSWVSPGAVVTSDDSVSVIGLLGHENGFRGEREDNPKCRNSWADRPGKNTAAHGVTPAARQKRSSRGSFARSRRRRSFVILPAE